MLPRVSLHIHLLDIPIALHSLLLVQMVTNWQAVQMMIQSECGMLPRVSRNIYLLVKILPSPQNVVWDVGFSSDGRILTSSLWEGPIHLWDSITGEQKKTLKGHTDEIVSLSFNKDSHTLASKSKNGTVLVWDLANIMNTTATIMNTTEPNR